MPSVGISLEDALGQVGIKLFSEDAAKLIEFMPEEVWLLVSRKLKQNDIVNYVNSSPYFWELTRKDRVFHLFPKVIRIIAPLFEKSKLQMIMSNKSEQEIQQEFSIERMINDDEIKETKKVTAAAKLWRSTVFNCRLVCLEWNRAVEMCYEKAEMTGIKEFENDFDPRSPLNTMKVELAKEKFFFSPQGQYNLLERLMKIFEESHASNIGVQLKNPFFGRSVLINTQNARELYDEYFYALIKMLELFGGYIWYCELTVSPQQVVFDLQRILNLMPNLKYLKLISNVRHPPRKNYVPSDLPVLENLQVLSLEFLESPLATEIIRKNCQVKYLSIYCCEVDDNVGSSLTSLKGYSTSNSIGDDGILGRFGNEWKLNNVEIWPRNDLAAGQLFSLLENRWSETLTNVTLKNPFTRDVDQVYEQSKSCGLKLPCVRRLCITSEHVFVLDFMEPMNRNLEHLEILAESCFNGAKYWNRAMSEQKIEWIGFKEEMNQSNIWSFFRKLKTIKIKFNSCGVSRRKEMVFTNRRQKLVYFEY